VEANRGKPPQRILDALLADLQAFSHGAAQSDDVTIVMVQFAH
jgi:serine phosphatase RsbU (regulator of sigma subunit)